MRALIAGRVVASNNPKFAVGDYVTRDTGSVQTYTVSSAPEKELVKRDTTKVPLEKYLGGLGV